MSGQLTTAITGKTASSLTYEPTLEASSSKLQFQLDNNEYGLPLKSTQTQLTKGIVVPPSGILYQPREFGILDGYHIIKEIYKV
jgi:hypothetical protein